MKLARLVLSISALLAASQVAHAQFVKGNEAVTISPTGVRHVETLPLPASISKPCPAANDGCAGGSWVMVETEDGLSECTEFYARKGTCRKSRYGIEKKSRLWLVKTHSQWKLCQYPDLASKCVRPSELPYDAVQ